MANVNHLADIKALLEKKRLFIGLDRTIKALKSGNLAMVYVASNTPKDVKADITYYGSLSGAQVIELTQPNEELGVTCRKPFPIAVIGVTKE